MNRRRLVGTVGFGLIPLGSCITRTSGQNNPRSGKIGNYGFNDKRSKRLIFVSHCVLNQNARIKKCAHWRTTMKPVMRFFEEHDIAVVQMPCPELIFLGLDREGQIYEQLGNQQIRKGLRDMARDICYQISEYRKNGFVVLAVVGINGSPCCGVTKTWDDYEKPGAGKFMIELKDELEKQKIEITLKSFEDNKMTEALEFLKTLV